MSDKTHNFAPNYILIFLFVAFVGFIMTYFSINSELVRLNKSDYSKRWTLNGEIINVDSIVTYRYGDKVSIYNTLPVVIGYNESLCFMSNNVFVDVFIGDEHVYSYSQPANFSGNGYGTAYHAVNLSPEQAGKSIRIDMRGVFSSKTTGQIRMLSIENSRDYFSRLAQGQFPSFIISSGIALLGVLLLFYRIILKTPVNGVNIVALGMTAIFTGGWLAIDTGFLRLAAGAVMLSRNLSYIFMHLCMLPLILFVYSITKSGKKLILIAAYVISALYYALVLTTRFVFNIDMASTVMFQCFFVYVILMLALLVYMMVLGHRRLISLGIRRNVSFFNVGLAVSAVCAFIDSGIYLSGARGISGYTIFSRVGFFVFFLNMCLEVLRLRSHEYAALKEYGFEDVLTGVGNRRSCMEFEKRHRDICPYAYIICDINGLKTENDTNGHAAGDRLIKAVSDKLVKVFGAANVFRVGGDEFVAYSFEPTEDGFNDKLELARMLLSAEDSSASIGGMYVADASTDRDAVKSMAEEIMYAEKRNYYESHKDRRR